MPNPPVCYYYQAGCCRNGNECTFTHPKIRCRTFASDGWCPYGYNCRFWHDPSVKLGVVNIIKKPCQFYANNQCKYGDKCNFSHDINAQNNSGITLEEYRATKTVTGVHINIEAQESTTTEMSHDRQDGISDASLTSVAKSNLITTSSSTCLNKNNRSCVRPPFQKYASVNAIDFQGASKAEICDLNHSELKRLKKQFPPDKLREVESNENYHMFCVRFSSTDPDWVSHFVGKCKSNFTGHSNKYFSYFRFGIILTFRLAWSRMSRNLVLTTTWLSVQLGQEILSFVSKGLDKWIHVIIYAQHLIYL